MNMDERSRPSALPPWTPESGTSQFTPQAPVLRTYAGWQPPHAASYEAFVPGPVQYPLDHTTPGYPQPIYYSFSPYSLPQGYLNTFPHWPADPFQPRPTTSHHEIAATHTARRFSEPVIAASNVPQQNQSPPGHWPDANAWAPPSAALPSGKSSRPPSSLLSKPLTPRESGPFWDDDRATSHFRGPPRKPRSTGYAVWVGNIPPDANILNLRDHFAQGSSSRCPQSVFLLPRSHCAFLNFKTWDACVDTAHKFNNIPFNGSRLLCRLRRPVKPAGNDGSEHSEDSDSQMSQSSEGGSASPIGAIAQGNVKPGTASKPSERYFIIKCLTLTDLTTSVRTGLWATQPTNEDKLNKAFKSTDNVYLIFSINKSGSYCGYARMESSIGAEGTLPHEPVQAPLHPSHMPNRVTTPATPHAPKGYIVDDKERGSIFWEAETTGDDITTGVENIMLADGVGSDANSPSECKPFKVRWISTKWVPFCQTNGLRNPWNMNQEVKIARDGTELEASVGRRLVSLF